MALIERSRQWEEVVVAPACCYITYSVCRCWLILLQIQIRCNARPAEVLVIVDPVISHLYLPLN